jgi:DNA recombination protein Rad52
MAFSAEQVRKLQRELKAANIRTRAINGRELSYIEGWHAIDEANRIFGFDGWSRETVESRCVHSRETRGAYSVLYVTRVKVTVRAETHLIVREGVGTGDAQADSLGEAHDKAIKTAETDATKRALATFGRPFGLALYLGLRAKPQPKPDIQRRRTLQKLGANGRFYVPASPRPPSASALLASAASPQVSPAQTPAVATPVPPASTSTPPDRTLLIERTRRRRDADHLRFVAAQPCLVCSRTPSDAHHLKFAQPRAMSSKVSDEFTVPLCRIHHRQLHHGGSEVTWWMDMDIDPLPIAKDLWEKSRSNTAELEPVDAQLSTGGG